MSAPDPSVVDHLLRLLREFVSDLQPHRGVDLPTLERDKVLRRFVERTLQMAAECCIDLGNHLISTQGLREPTGNRDVFRVLEEASVLEPELAARLRGMAGFRNVVVHGYARIDVARLHEILRSDLDDLVEFGQSVQRWRDRP